MRRESPDGSWQLLCTRAKGEGEGVDVRGQCGRLQVCMNVPYCTAREMGNGKGMGMGMGRGTAREWERR